MTTLGSVNIYQGHLFCKLAQTDCGHLTSTKDTCAISFAHTHCGQLACTKDTCAPEEIERFAFKIFQKQEWQWMIDKYEMVLEGDMKATGQLHLHWGWNHCWKMDHRPCCVVYGQSAPEWQWEPQWECRQEGSWVPDVQVGKPPTFLEEVLQLVLERLQILLWGLLAHQLHLLLTCCKEKYRLDLIKNTCWDPAGAQCSAINCTDCMSITV